MSMTSAEKIKAIIRDAGGEIVGRTRLQKIAYLLTATGLEDGFSFAYKHYGPFSDDVAKGARVGSLLGQIQEEERPTAWGGFFSIYRVGELATPDTCDVRRSLVQTAVAADAVELELAATAVFLANEGIEDPWGETARRKPEKSEGQRLQRAKQLLQQLQELQTPKPLPAMV